MDERRRFVRLDTRIEASYSVLSKGRAARVVTKNVSAGGICLFLEEEIAPGTRLQVDLTLPDRKKPVRFTAEVAWCEAYEMVAPGEHRRSVEAGPRVFSHSSSSRWS